VVTFIDMRDLIWHSTVINSADREAACIIDGLMQSSFGRLFKRALLSGKRLSADIERPSSKSGSGRVKAGNIFWALKARTPLARLSLCIYGQVIFCATWRLPRVADHESWHRRFELGL
jgi:hypothetical protein